MIQALFYILEVYLALTAIMVLVLLIRHAEGTVAEMDKKFQKDKRFVKYLAEHLYRTKTSRFIGRTIAFVVIFFMLFIYSVLTGMALRIQWWR